MIQDSGLVAPPPPTGGVPPGEGSSRQEDPLGKEGGTACGLKVVSPGKFTESCISGSSPTESHYTRCLGICFNPIQLYCFNPLSLSTRAPVSISPLQSVSVVVA